MPCGACETFGGRVITMATEQGVDLKSVGGEQMPVEVATDTLRATHNEVLRKIGRNLLLFQQMEGLLKLLVANAQFAGLKSEFPSVLEKRAEAVSKRTMGQLVGEYLESSFSEEDPAPSVSDELQEGWFSFRFTEGLDAAFVETRRIALAEIVGERNELIHHFLPRWSSTSLESTLDADAWLDRQHKKALPEFEHLSAMVNALKEGARQLAEYLDSDAGRLASLRHSPLVVMLGDIAQQRGRADGFLLLNTAGELLRRHAPEEFAMMKERYGYKTLKSLILAAGVFDILEEPTEKGGVRVLYRVNPRWVLEIGADSEGKGIK